MASSVRSDDGTIRGDVRTSINILVLGDDSVGKSSLISTFVSRHFSEVVPGLMTRVRLPPDPDSNCLTTIVDSQAGDTALISAIAKRSMRQDRSVESFSSLLDQQQTGKSKSSASSTSSSSSSYLEHVDSIILVYDLDRVETFFRLENYWLPLIERCYSGEMPVIVAGNKMDLVRPVTDEQALVRSRQQLVSLLQRFRFVRQCIKCSAKNLLRVNELFVKAQQAVLYPFAPLFDLSTGRLTSDASKAFTRIFRMYDKDHDGLLSNAELDAFQYQTFRVPLVERDLAGWKKVVSRNSEEQVVKDGKFTVAGFLAIFDVFISQNRLDVPWKVLRKFGYDDQLNLAIPLEDNKKSGKLSSSARQFLVALFNQFDSDKDGKLSSTDIATIFSILPEPSLPPWHPMRARTLLNGCFSVPRSKTTPKPSDESMALSLTASGIILSASSLPSMDTLSSASSATKTTSPASQVPMTLLEWMGHWHMISAISPPAATSELYRLGHVIGDTPKRKKRRRAQQAYPMLPSEEIQLFVMGSSDAGKSSLLLLLCGIEIDENSVVPETSCTHMMIKRRAEKAQDEDEEAVVHFTITHVPHDLLETQKKELSSQIESPGGNNRMRRLVVLCFDSDSDSSLSYAINVERDMLSEGTPRLFVATRGSDKADTMSIAQEHCADLDLNDPLVVDGDDGAERMVVLRHLVGCVLENTGHRTIKSVPHAEQKKREAERRRKMIWLGSIVSVSVAVAVGVGVLWRSVGSGDGDARKAGRFRWLTQMFFGTPATIASAATLRDVSTATATTAS